MFYLLNNTSFWFAFGTIVFLTIVPFLFNQTAKWNFVIAGIVAIGLLFMGFRTAAVTAATIFLFWLYLNNNLKWYFTIIAAIIFTMAFCIKNGSTNGRWFITKRTIEIIKENPNGIEFGKFKVIYGHYQAGYFRQNSITSSAALGADNTEFAFNEYLQVTAEGGVLIGIIFTLFTIFSIKSGINLCRTKKDLSSCLYTTGFIGICISSLTFYMLHNWWVLLIYTTCLLGIYLPFILDQHKVIIITILFFLSSSLVIGINSYKNYSFRQELQVASTLSHSGYKQYADSIFLALANDSTNIKYKIDLSQHYLNFNNTKQAVFELLKINKEISNDDINLLIGDAYLANADTLNAINYYETAVYMVPKRFMGRKKLAEIYRQTKNVVKELFWLQAIIDLPEKIPSATTKQIKKQANRRLMDLKTVTL